MTDHYAVIREALEDVAREEQEEYDNERYLVEKYGTGNPGLVVRRAGTALSSLKALEKTMDYISKERVSLRAENTRLREALDDCRAAWKRMREMPSGVPIEVANLRAENTGLRGALREIADYRNNDAQLRALDIARQALSEGERDA